MLKILSNCSLSLQAWWNKRTRLSRRRAHMRRTWARRGNSFRKPEPKIIAMTPDVWWKRDDPFFGQGK